MIVTESFLGRKVNFRPLIQKRLTLRASRSLVDPSRLRYVFLTINAYLRGFFSSHACFVVLYDKLKWLVTSNPSILCCEHSFKQTQVADYIVTFIFTWRSSRSSGFLKSVMASTVAETSKASSCSVKYRGSNKPLLLKSFSGQTSVIKWLNYVTNFLSDKQHKKG